MKEFIGKYKLSFFAAAAAGSLRSIAALFVAVLVSRMAEIVTARDRDAWGPFFLLCASYYLCYLFLYYLSKRLQLRTLQRWRTDFKDRLFHAVLSMDYLSFSGAAQGTFLSRLTNDVNVLEEQYCREILETVYNVASFLFTVCFMSALNLPLTALLLLLLALYYVLSKRINGKLSDYQLSYVKARERETASLQELTQGFRAAAQYGAGERLHARHAAIVEEAEHASLRYSVAFTFLTLFNNHIEPFLCVLILLSGALSAGGSAGVAGVLAMTQLAGSLVKPAAAFGTSYSRLKSSRKVRLQEEETLAAGREGETEWNGSHACRGDIVLSDVSFSYDGNKQVLSHADAVFKEGGKYAVIGKSGEGKTTLIKLILNLQKPESGRITIGGTDYASLTPGDLAGGIAYLGQDIYLFRDTLKNNITLGREGDFEKAAEYANIGTLIGKLKEGDASLAKEDGSNFSGGEKQRIAIARAVYTDKPVMLLDEFSSALDEGNSRQIERNLLSGKNQTVLVITHKLKKEDYGLYDAVYELKDRKLTAVKNG